MLEPPADDRPLPATPFTTTEADVWRRIPDASRSSVRHGRALGTLALLIALSVGARLLWSLPHAPVPPVASHPAPVDSVGAAPATAPASPGGVLAVVPVPDHLVMCRHFDGQGGAADPTDTYGVLDAFHCSVHFVNMNATVPVEARWMHDGQLLRATRTVAGVNGDTNLDFSLTPGHGWPTGAYSVAILISHQAVGTISFLVSDRPGGAPPVAMTSPSDDESPASSMMASSSLQVEAVMCRSLGTSFDPVEPTEIFHAGDALHCSLRLHDARRGQEFKVRWYNDHHLMKETDHALSADLPDGYVGFTLMQPEGLAPGLYQVDVVAAGQTAAHLSFRVVP